MKTLIAASLLMMKLTRSTDTIPNVIMIEINEKMQREIISGVAAHEEEGEDEDLPDLTVATPVFSYDRDFVMACSLDCVKAYIETFITTRFPADCEAELATVRPAVEQLIVANLLVGLHLPLRKRAREAFTKLRRRELETALKKEIDRLIALSSRMILFTLVIFDMTIHDMLVPGIAFIVEHVVNPPAQAVSFVDCTGVNLEAFNEYGKEIPHLRRLEVSNCDVEKIVIPLHLPELEIYSFEKTKITGFDPTPFKTTPVPKAFKFTLFLTGNPITDEDGLKQAISEVCGAGVRVFLV